MLLKPRTASLQAAAYATSHVMIRTKKAIEENLMICVSIAMMMIPQSSFPRRWSFMSWTGKPRLFSSLPQSHFWLRKMRANLILKTVEREYLHQEVERALLHRIRQPFLSNHPRDHRHKREIPPPLHRNPLLPHPFKTWHRGKDCLLQSPRLRRLLRVKCLSNQSTLHYIAKYLPLLFRVLQALLLLLVLQHNPSLGLLSHPNLQVLIDMRRLSIRPFRETMFLLLSCLHRPKPPLLFLVLPKRFPISSLQGRLRQLRFCQSIRCNLLLEPPGSLLRTYWAEVDSFTLRRTWVEFPTSPEEVMAPPQIIRDNNPHHLSRLELLRLPSFSRNRQNNCCYRE
jgi:hypothetical protein